jgi:D-alanyl-lipoteichoic acid acyltransferase DltB (MBOAT superfamily)
MLDFSTFDYFAWLLSLCVVLLPVYYVLPWAPARRALLTATGCYLLFLVAPRLMLLYIIFWLVVTALQGILAILGERKAASYALMVSVLGLLAPLVYWKLVPADSVIRFNVELSSLARGISPYLGAIDAASNIILPIGLSFAVFRGIDLLIQTYLGVIPRLSPGRILFYGFFPPVQIIGPVIEYSELEAPGRPPPSRWPLIDDISSGLSMIVIGLVKVFVLAYPLEQAADVFVFYETNGALVLWFELVLFAWFFYLNFAGYSDMSIGVARLFGYKLKPNFNLPYFRTSPQDYWNNWHMSLTRFAQRNVFTPLGGMRQERQYVAVAATIMVIALWHNISWALVVFGLYHGAGLILARLSNVRRPAQTNPSIPLRVGKNLVMFMFVLLGLPLLILQLEDAPDFYLALVGA